MKSGTTIISGDGSIQVIDPDISFLPVLKEIQPDFKVLSDAPGKGFIPGFQKLKNGFIYKLTDEELHAMKTDMLWGIHNAAMEERIPLVGEGEVSALDMKVELANRILRACSLCGWNCGVDRVKQVGRCGAGPDAFYNGLFVHICEEEVINPAWNIKLEFCPMECVFCQSPENLLHERDSVAFGKDLWPRIAGNELAKSIEFVGGEPMVSTKKILEFLTSAPGSFSLPVVMNCSAFVSQTAVRLMEGVVDVWMPDLKFGSSECAKHLSGAEHYWETAATSISMMCGQNSRTIVRLLVLPNHTQCCSKKVLDWLSQYKSRVWISIMDQYLPLNQAHRFSDINRIPSESEIKEVRVHAKKRRLKDVNEQPRGTFWRGGLR